MLVGDSGKDTALLLSNGKGGKFTDWTVRRAGGPRRAARLRAAGTGRGAGRLPEQQQQQQPPCCQQYCRERHRIIRQTARLLTCAPAIPAPRAHRCPASPGALAAPACSWPPTVTSAPPRPASPAASRATASSACWRPPGRACPPPRRGGGATWLAAAQMLHGQAMQQHHPPPSRPPPLWASGC